MKIFVLSFFAFFLLHFQVQAAEQTCVYGKLVGYPETTINLYAFADEITHQQKIISTASVDSTGAFEFAFSLDEVRKCFIDLGSFRGVLFLEPSKTYHLQALPYTPKTNAQLLNMFFTPQEVLVGVQSDTPNDINQKIVDFELAIDEVWNNAMFQDITKAYLLAVIDSIDALFPSQNHFFTVYKQSTFAQLANLQVDLAPYWSIQDYFVHIPVELANPAYCESFIVLFEGFFNRLEYQPKARNVLVAYQKGDIGLLKEQFSLFVNWNNPQLEELVIVYNLWGNFSAKPRDRSIILSLLEQILSSSQFASNKQIAQGILQELKRAQVGTKPAVNTLQTIQGKEISFSDFEGKFVYIVFASSLITETYADIVYLDKLHNKYAENLEVVFIFAQENKEKTIAYTKGMNTNLILCNWNNDTQLIEAFGVRNIPYYYLLDREGFFSHSPALSPGQGFERKLDAMLELERVSRDASKMNKPFFK